MSQLNRTKSVLSDDLFLYTVKYDEPLSFSYEIECTSLKHVVLTLNFEGSENFMVKGSNSLQLTSTIRPFSRHEMGTISLIDKSRRAMLKMNCEWKIEEPDEEEIRNFLLLNSQTIQKSMLDAFRMSFPPIIEDEKNELTTQLCSKYGKLFVDLEFPPTHHSLYKQPFNNQQPIGDESFAYDKNIPIEWKRVSEFMKGSYDVFTQGIEPSDIRQGALGDSWFLCAIAALAEFPALVKDLFTEDSSNANPTGGVYTIKLCKSGMWKKYRVDDYFPCYPGGGPIYSRSHGNELWVLLLEKAFAKSCGSYEAIKAGWAYEAMIDLTGAPYKTFRLDDPDVKGKINSGELWKLIFSYDQENFIMSASTPGEDIYTETGRKPGKENTTGLVAGHAYTLISVRQSSKGDKLLKLRNPWGSMEWTGDWSDKSSLWTEQMQAEIEPLVDADDGCFWMCFEDVLKYFYSINVCMVRHPVLNKTPWNEERRRLFIEYQNPSPEIKVDPSDLNSAPSASDFINCPTFILHVSKPGRFIVSIHQEDIRCAGSKPYIDIGVSVMKVDPTYRTFELIAGTGNSVERQNQSDEFELQTGKYLVVPTTTGSKLHQYMMKKKLSASSSEVGGNVTSNNKSAQRPLPELIRTLDNGNIDFTISVYNTYEEIFSRFDNDCDGYLSFEELNDYMVRTEGSPIEESAYAWLLHNFESVQRKGLTVVGFIRAQLYVFKSLGANVNDLMKELKALGYNEYLEYIQGRPVTLVIHSTGDFKLYTNQFDHEAFHEALKLPVMKNGDSNQFEGGKIKMYKCRSSYKGLSFVVENKHTFPLVFILDCTGSTNVISHHQSLSHQETIPPGQSRIMHHLMPEDGDSLGWAWAYSASYMWDEDGV